MINIINKKSVSITIKCNIWQKLQFYIAFVVIKHNWYCVLMYSAFHVLDAHKIGLLAQRHTQMMFVPFLVCREGSGHKK